jgi:signal transduction histidine kinase
MLLSLIIAFTVAILIRNIGFTVQKDSKEKRISQRYEECITELEDKLLKCDIKDVNKVNAILEENYSQLLGYEFYVVDENGKVISSSTPGMLEIDKVQIIDGARNYQISKSDPNVFKIAGCDSIKNGYYLYYTYLYFDKDDTGMVAGALIGAVICFFFLIWGRISYISTVRLSVDKMTQGDFGERVPCLYKNELRGLAEDINQMAEALENEEQKKNEFLTNISHDIRTPLTTILGYLNMIKNKNYDSEEALQGYIGIMERKGKFLSSMLEDFFQYSKLASHDIVINYIKLDLNELLRQMQEDEEEEFMTKELKLELQLSSKSIHCMGDPELLARALGNLLSNSIKYSKRNTSVLMKSSIEKVNYINYGVFSISNVPKESILEEEVLRLFERLYKRDNARKEEGSGLGLSIANNIIKLHGGKVEGHIVGERLLFKVYIRM